MSGASGPPDRRHFASDNQAGICPEAWKALEEANRGHQPSYGDDPWTDQARRLIAELFETDCEVFFVFNGTSANSLALAAACEPFDAVLCHELAHIETDESNAPGFFRPGLKLLPLPGVDGKLTPASIVAAASNRRDLHASRASAVSLTNATEIGTVYSADEIAAIGAVARERGLTLHVDGARLANAVASLGVSPRKLIPAAGVDVVSLGGTKNGLACGEAMVFFNRALAANFDRRIKQSGQLVSKMRFVTAPWVGLLRDGGWLRNGRHANAMATLLADRLRKLPEIALLFPTQANAVFAKLPDRVVAALRAGGERFYTDVGPGGGARLMCAWDTTVDDVESLASKIENMTR
jgi:threonine aldolase